MTQATQIHTERVRGFQPPWRTVYAYTCPSCKHDTRINANAYTGKRATRPVGAFQCACGQTLSF